jgi:hypothetical protein
MLVTACSRNRVQLALTAPWSSFNICTYGLSGRHFSHTDGKSVVSQPLRLRSCLIWGGISEVNCRFWVLGRETRSRCSYSKAYTAYRESLSTLWLGRSGTTARVSFTVKARYDARTLEISRTWRSSRPGGGASGSAYTTNDDWTAFL